MTAWHLLPLLFLISVVGAYLSYTGARERPYYPLKMMLLGVVAMFILATAIRWLHEKPKIYVFNVWYDALMVVAYYVLPIVLFGAKLSPGALVGASLVAVGLITLTVFG